MTIGRRPIVIVGVPRSGTTWTLRTLGTSPGVRKAFEPDNEEWHAAAIHGKHHLGRYPVLDRGERDRAYHHLWEWILEGAHESARSRLALLMLSPGRMERRFDAKTDLVTWVAGEVARDPLPTSPLRHRAPERVVAKSIHAQLSLSWLTDEFDVDVLVMLRHPANVLSSWLGMNLKDSRSSVLESRPDVRSHYLDRWGVPLPGDDRVEQLSWRIALLTAALEEAVDRDPRLHVRTHETLCTDPGAQFRGLFTELQLDWSPATEEFLRDHDTPGEGFTLFRTAADLPEVWQTRLDDRETATLQRVLGWFPISTWGERDFEREGRHS